MITKNMDGNVIYDLFISGAKNLINSEELLNRINVFPVPDGDTGTNLALTMKSIVANAIKDINVHKSLTSISNVAIANAYGNSGMIFAQYLNGFAIESQEKEKLSHSEFAEIASKAALYAYEAVTEPKEGTILSLMKDWAFDIKNNLNLSDFDMLFEHSVIKAKSLVEQTKFQLKELFENNVVDAGAKGFLIFLEGILEFIKKGESSSFSYIEKIELNDHINIVTNTDVTKNRYCSQFYIRTQRKPCELKEQLRNLGDSLIITGSDSNLQIHIHTDYPAIVMSHLALEDTILSQKIEDMKLMSSIIHKRKHSIGIITDSIADLPKQFIDDEQITVIPSNLICDSIIYQDKLTMTPELIYEKIQNCKKHPTSAQPTPKVIEDTLTNLLKYYDSIICIFISEHMSGTSQYAQKIAERLAASGSKISIINSKLNSSAEGLLVMEAALLLNEGLSHEKVVELLETIKSSIHIYVTVNNLSSMIKGGRISKRSGFILRKIHLKPVISIDSEGKGIVYKKTFSQIGAIKKIFHKIKQDLNEYGIEKYAVVYSENNDDVQKFCDKLVNLTGMNPVFVEPISPIVALNAGMGAYAVSYIKKGSHKC